MMNEEFYSFFKNDFTTKKIKRVNLRTSSENEYAIKVITINIKNLLEIDVSKGSIIRFAIYIFNKKATYRDKTELLVKIKEEIHEPKKTFPVVLDYKGYKSMESIKKSLKRLKNKDLAESKVGNSDTLNVAIRYLENNWVNLKKEVKG